MRRALLILSIACTSCIPVKKTFVTWPARTLRVSDAKGPIEGAKVHVTRERHPHSTEDESRDFTTDDKGEVKLVEEKTSLTVFPLMMHGVPGFSFTACAEAPGHAGVRVDWWNDSKPLELVLPRGSRPCTHKGNPEVPSGGRLRLDGIEEKDGAWLVDLAVPRAVKLEPGSAISDRDAKLTIREIVSRTSNAAANGEEAPLQFTRVRAEGDGARWTSGDLIDR
ncbi:MAG: hypothetical protein ACXWUG_17405 [Polyangiales bacterium]